MKRNHKRGNLITVASALTVAAVTVIPNAASASQFTDIQGSTHENAIVELVGKGLIKGYPDGTFKPNKMLTRSDVVKLMGKYLVANGYEIPADYNTKMRFTDLSSKLNDELLQYAALVKDQGIFNGNQGKLKPTDNMTRENMAVVLVNTLSTIHQFDYSSYIASRDFQSKIEDLEKANLGTRSAIKVLDFYHVTNVYVFNPKSSSTRGQFASFLNNLSKINEPLSVTEVDVLSKDQLTVTLSDQTTHIVTLSKPLSGNTQETVNFSIEGIQYTAVVEYKEAVPPINTGGTTTNPDKEESGQDSQKSRFIVKSDGLLSVGFNSNGRLVEVDDANLKVYGFIDQHEVELPSSAYTITSDSEYLNINGNKVTPNLEAINEDNLLEDESDKYETEIVVTINQSGESIKHKLTLSREDVKANNKFKLIDKNSISKKLLNDIDIDITDTDLELTTSDIFSEILEEGYFEIEDQYGAPVTLTGTTGEVKFFDGSTDTIRLIVTNINTNADKTVISNNGTNNVTLVLGENGLSEGDSFTLTLSIDEVSQTIKVYIQ